MSRATHPSARQIRIAFLVTALGGLLFTFDLPLLRLSQADQWTMVFTRGIFLFLAISLVWFVTRGRDGENTPFIAGRAGMLVAITSTIGNMAYIGAIVQTNAANVVFIIALTPVIAAAMSRILLGEKVHVLTWTAAALAFLGVGIIAWDGIQAGKFMGDMLALVSAFCSASAFTVVRATRKKVATSLAVGSLSSALIALIFFQVSLPELLLNGSFGVPAWVWLGLNGFIAIPVATMLLARGPRVLPSADVSMFFMLETVLTPVWIWLIFNEVPGRMVLAGGAVVISTLVLHSFWRLRRTSRPLQSVPQEY
jgi:drug/metabolite transporter (DMT)-like permease